MAVHRGTKKFIDNFDRPLTLTTTPEGGGFGWTIADTSSAGAPTYTTGTEDGGALAITLASTNEVENVCMYAADKLMFDLRMLQHFWLIAKVASISSTTCLTMGLGSARNDTDDTVAYNCRFRMEGSVSTSLLYVETDDDTTNDDDNSTVTTLAAVYKKLHIDFTHGISDIRFYVDGARVIGGTTFSMAAAVAGQNVQPIIQLSKTQSTSVPAVTIAQVGVQYNWAYGA